jgi:DNA modification methylase
MKAEILVGDCRKVLAELPAESVHCVVTSPPYFGLRDYGHPDQIGLEATPAAFVAELVGVFREVRRVLRPDGVLWINLGDTYATRYRSQRPCGRAGFKEGERCRSGVKVDGFKEKDLIGIPWRVAFALQDDGWWLRCDCIWDKPNGMPESVADRPTRTHEYLFLLTKSEDYYYDAEAVREASSKTSHGAPAANPGAKQVSLGQNVHGNLGVCSTDQRRNKRSVWTVPTKPYKGAHYATFPPDLVAPMILAGCPEGGTVLDPFGGSGTVGEVATKLGRRSILIELNPEYAEQAEMRNLQYGLDLVG